MAPVLVTLAVALLAYVLGRATLPLFIGRRARPPQSVLALELLLGNVLLSVIGLLLAELGGFTILRVVSIAMVVCVGALAIRRLQARHSSAYAYDRTEAVGLALMIGAYLWAFPPFDTSLFASDSSTYLAAGVHIAERGSLVIHDPTVALLQPEQRARLFPLYHPDTGTPPYLRVGGGLVLNDLDSGRVLSGFPPLLSVWVAIFYSLGGDNACAGPITYFGALFLCAFTSFTAGLAGRWAAGLALVLLTSLVPQYWYSRFLMPEIPSQYFLWAGLWTGALSLSHPGTRLGALAGLAIGVAGLMRFDVMIHVAAGLALWTAVAPARSLPAGPGFVPALAVMMGYAIVHQALFPTHYVAEVSPRLLIAIEHLRIRHLLDYRLAGLVVLVLVVGGISLARSGRTERTILLRVALRIAAAAAFVVYAVAIVAAARPDFTTNLAWLGLYVGWPLICLAAVGAFVWFRGARNSAERFVLVFGLLSVAQLFFYPPVSPQPLWAIRRFLRIALPLVTIAAGIALSRWVERRRWLLVIAVLAVMLGFRPRLAFTYLQPAYQHTMDYVRSIGALVPRGAVVVGEPMFFADSQLHIALWITRDAPAYAVGRTRTESLRELRHAFHDRPMFWIGPLGRGPLVSGDLRLVPVGNYTFGIASRRMEPYDTRDDLGLRQMTFAVYRIELDPSPIAATR